MDKLKELLLKCNYGVYLTVNQHKDYYQTVEGYFEEIAQRGDYIKVEKEIMSEMVETDTVIELEFYPKDPNTCYNVTHYSIGMALDEALSCFK